MCVCVCVGCACVCESVCRLGEGGCYLLALLENLTLKFCGFYINMNVSCSQLSKALSFEGSLLNQEVVY